MRTIRTRKTLALFVAAVVMVATLGFASPASASNTPLTARQVSSALQGVGDRLVQPAVAQSNGADVRNDGTIHFSTKNAGDIVITLPYASAHKAKAVDGSVMYRNTHNATVVIPTADGAQTLLVAADKSAPAKYPFGVQNGSVTSLPGGGLLLLDHNHQPARAIPAPWAVDAAHKAVATSYTVSADHTMFWQAVGHDANGVKYPVVADPWISYQPILWWPSNQKVGDRVIVYLDRFETSNIAGTGVSVATALLVKASLPNWVAPFAVTIARQAVYSSGKCATVQFDLMWGWLPNVTTWVRNC